MRRVLAAGLMLAAFAFGACGSDDEPTEGSEETELSSLAPEPAAELDDAVVELNEAIANEDCEQIVALTYSATRANAQGDGPAEPGDPAAPDECAKNSPAQGLLGAIAGTEFDESEEYGPAAISQGPAGKPIQGYDLWAVIWLVDRDGEWRQISFYPTDPQFDEELPEAADPVGVTEQMVSAMQEGDCRQAEEFMGAQLRFGATPQEACEALAGGTIFAPAVQAAEDVTVEEIGTSRDYSIVGVDTGETYFAVHLATPPIKPDQPPQDEVQVTEVVPMTDFEIVEQATEKG